VNPEALVVYMNPTARQVNLNLSALLLSAICFIASSSLGQTLTVLHGFSNLTNGTNQDGSNPMVSLASVGSVLCGTTVNGGRYGAGAMFYLNPDGTGFNAFRSFTNSPDAGNPQADLLAAGNLFYGTSFGGGSSGVGTVFAGQTNVNTLRLYSFAALNSDTATNAPGASPGGPVILSGGTLYGTATAGGISANGVVFSVNTNGSAFTVLHTFTALDCNAGTNADGAVPWSGLVLSGDTLYGTTSAGGTGGNGTVFSINTNGSNFTMLYSFTAMDPLTGTNTDGAIPRGGLVLSNGTLYGTAQAGGFGNCGAVFAVGTNGSGFVVLHHFSPVDATTKTNIDGAKPVAGLILSGGTLYGTTPAGGTGADGTVFSVSTDGSQFRALYSFTATNPGNGTNNDGAIPVGDLLLLGNSLYGTTFAGGSGSVGTVFRLSLPAAPALITGIVRNPDGSVTLSFFGSPNSTNIIQAATTLAPSDWQDISTNVTDAGGLWQYTDTDAGQFPMQFYRSYTH
jgi:uncharacterized repeat protein (TIGR03803 family)